MFSGVALVDYVPNPFSELGLKINAGLPFGLRAIPMVSTIRPARIRLEASSRCQLRCPSCPTTTGAIKPVVGSGFLKLRDFRQLIEANPGLKTIELSNWGEIFLNPELLEIMEYACAHDVHLTAENGVNLNHVRDEVLEGLVKYRFRSLTVSLDGTSQESYEIYRVRGDYQRVVEHIQKINVYKAQYGSEYPRLYWQFVVFGHNEHEIARARELAAEWNMTLYFKLGWDNEFSPIRDMEAVRRAMDTGVATRAEYREKFGTEYLDQVCHQLWDLPQVNWDGKMLGCCRNYWDEFGGNVFQDGLNEVVNSPKLNVAREMLQGKHADDPSVPCSACEVYKAMAQTGRFLDRSRLLPGWRGHWARFRARLAWN